MQLTSASQRTINILIVHSHQLIREGVKNMLGSSDTSFKFDISEADSGEAALGRPQLFDVVIVDYELPGMKGSQAILQLRAKNPHTRFLALLYENESAYVRDMTTCGAVGYVSTNVNSMQLVRAIECMIANKPFSSAGIPAKSGAGTPEGGASELEKLGLTKRELEILCMIAQEKTNEDMAEMLFISKRTVDTHRQNLLHKLRARNTAGLIRAAYQLKIV